MGHASSPHLVGIVLVLALQAVVFAITVVVVPGSFSPAIFHQQIARSHLRGLPTAAVVAVGVLSLTSGTLVATDSDGLFVDRAEVQVLRNVRLVAP